MAGLPRHLIDHALGYDDQHRSTTDERRENFARWYTRARTEYVLQLTGPKPYVRPPATEGEYIVQKIIESVFARMKRTL